VTLTGRNTVKLPLSVDPGDPPEHWSPMSPTRSVKPSDRTCKGVLVTWQRPVKDVCATKGERKRPTKRTHDQVRLKQGPIAPLYTLHSWSKVAI
jgi:hypothetical protein